MEKKVLQSMTDFILEGEEYTTSDYEMLNELNVRYAKFLQQKLELWMFVPCDDKGNVLPDNLDFDDRLCGHCPLEKKGVYGVDGGYMAGCEGSRCEEAKEKYSEIYQQAKDRVLFEGWAYHEDNVVEFKGDGYSYYLDMDEQTTLEDFTENEAETRVLTPTAIKQIYR